MKPNPYFSERYNDSVLDKKPKRKKMKQITRNILHPMRTFKIKIVSLNKKIDN